MSPSHEAHSVTALMQVGFMCQHVVSSKLRNGFWVKLVWRVDSERCACTRLMMCVVYCDTDLREVPISFQAK